MNTKSLKTFNNLITLSTVLLLAISAFLWGRQMFTAGEQGERRRATPEELEPLGLHLNDDVVKTLISPTPAVSTPTLTPTPSTTPSMEEPTPTPEFTPTPTVEVTPVAEVPPTME